MLVWADICDETNLQLTLIFWLCFVAALEVHLCHDHFLYYHYCVDVCVYLLLFGYYCC